MTAPTKTPSKSIYFQRIVEELKLDTRDPFTQIFAKACALLDQRDDLRRELVAARAEADELARRVLRAFYDTNVAFVRYGPELPAVENLIARVRAEMEKER